jgi:molecular chaperone Hsp33
MDLLTKWIDRSAQLRIASLDATRTARSLCLLHDLEGEAALRFSQAVAGSLLLASDLKPGLTLSLQIDLGEVAYHADATSEGLVRAMTTSRSHASPSARVQVRRVGPSGILYQSVVESLEGNVPAALHAFMVQSEQQESRLDLSVELDRENLPAQVRGALLRGFPGTPPDLLERLLSSWDSRGGSWHPASPWTGLVVGPWDALGTTEPKAFCPCDRDRARGALLALGEEELRDALEKGEELEVICDFCRTRYAFPPAELAG